MRWLDDGKLNRLHPKLFAGPSVEAVQISLLARVFGTSDKDAPVRNDGAAVTRTWENGFPSDVIRRSPMKRRFVLLSDTIPERPAELRPIPGPHRHGQQQGKRSSSLKTYSAIHVQGEAPESDDSSRDCEAKRVDLSLLAGAYSTRQSSDSEPSLPPKVIRVFHVFQESFRVGCHVVLFRPGKGTLLVTKSIVVTPYDCRSLIREEGRCCLRFHRN